MENKPDIPNGLAMPDDRAKKINEVLNKKPITPEAKLAETLEDMVQDIALIKCDPVNW